MAHLPWSEIDLDFCYIQRLQGSVMRPRFERPMFELPLEDMPSDSRYTVRGRDSLAIEF